MSKIIKSITKSIFGGGEEAAAPTPEPTKVMPSADEESLAQARKKTMAAQQAQSGRASTVFTKDKKKKLGG